MKIKLKESIRANGVQYLPPAVVDTDEIGITQADADVLIRRGTAVAVSEPAAPAATEATAETAEQPAETEDAAPAEPEPEPAPAKPAAKKK